MWVLLDLWQTVIQAKMFYSQEGDDGSMSDSYAAQLSQWHSAMVCAASHAAAVWVHKFREL